MLSIWSLRLGARAAAGTARGLTAAADGAAVAVMPTAPGTSGRYASALYSAASKNGALQAVSADVADMQRMQSESPAFDSFLRNPTLPRNAKSATLGHIVKLAGFSETFGNFLMVIADNGRATDTDKILSAYTTMVASTEGKVVVTVTTTMPLSDWELALLKKKIKSRFYGDDNSELTVETAIDESLLGGLTIQIGDRFMDLSTRTELRMLTEVISRS
jgi:F-type H+-transporting ATPase subunit O